MTIRSTLLMTAVAAALATTTIPALAQRSPGAAPVGRGPSAALRTPAKLKEVAPATYKVEFDTSAGSFVVEVHRDWAPKGADRFYNLVKHGYYDDGRFFRVIPNFMVQFGINGNPAIQRFWQNANIPDDPVTQTNKRGAITFATAGPNSRTTQVFINYRNNAALDRQGFAPFGEVISGMDVVDKINAQHKEEPEQPRIQSEGNRYLMKVFPKLDFIKSARIGK